MAGILRLLSDAFGTDRTGLVDTKTLAKRPLETVEAWETTVRGTPQTESGQGLGGPNRREPSRSVADRSQPRPELRPAQCLLPVAWPADVSGSTEYLTSRIAVYGPVRTVVWEGSGREAAPYPDWRKNRFRLYLSGKKYGLGKFSG